MKLNYNKENKMERILFTSESVTEGHPDKMCDQISDAILDAIIKEDKDCRVACETVATTGMIIITGEITTCANINYAEIARCVIKDIGYRSSEIGFDADTCAILTSIDRQSCDIALGVNCPREDKADLVSNSILGAGDQGMVFGYACNETPELMPFAISLAHKLTKKLSDVRKSEAIEYLRPDGKSQVTVEYVDGKPTRVDTIIISAQHSPDVDYITLEKDLKENIIYPIVPKTMIDKNTKILINPTGRFVVGGPQGDSGLTGRKIIVDTYGGYARHGGGAFSGKDPTKVDRSAAYMARYIAKNIVAADLAEKCEIQISYAIGVANPVSIMIDTFGTSKYSSKCLLNAVNKVFDMRPSAIIESLELKKPIYKQLASYGHMGRIDLNVAWEKIDKVDELLYAIETIDGNVSTANFVSQTVRLNVPKETTLMLSGWGKANSVPTGEDNTGNLRTFRIVANILYDDGTREDQAADFNPNVTDWQYSAAAIVPKKPVTSITVYLSYDYNGNTAYFDDVSLTIEPAQTYTYDDNGNLRSTLNQDGNESLINYIGSSSDIANFTNIYGHKYEYEYLTVNNVSTHSVSKMKKMSSDGTTAMQTLSYQYDAYGNIIDTTLAANGQSSVVHSESAFIENGNFLSSMTDALGGVTSKGYTGGKLLAYVQNALNNRTGYIYDTRDRVTTVYSDTNKNGSADAGEAKVQYSYANNRLNSIATAKTTYTFTYDSFGNMTSVKAGGNTLVSYSYRSGNGKLQSVTYGNGDTEEYIYDALDRLVSVKYNNAVTYTLTYDANGSLAKCVDNKSGITHEYEYDSLGRLIRAWQKNTVSGAKTLAVENVYDAYGRADKSSYVVNGKTLTYDLTYKNNSNLVSRILMPQSGIMSAINYTYDGFDRLTCKNISMSTLHDIYEEYSYYGYTSGGVQYTTGLVSSVALKKDGATTATYSYTYDLLGNITQIRKDGTLVNVYEYDSMGQLVREYDCATGTATVYEYDKSGNITHKYLFNGFSSDVPSWHIMACYPLYLSSEVAYTYSTSNWGDLLTNYNGTDISYDPIGNPLNWRNASSFTWDGRQLTNVNLTVGSSASYTYNAEGVRTSKTFGGTTHQYALDGTKIISETVSGDENYTFYYLYDVAGSVQGFIYGNVYYYFQKNVQGDIIGICDILGETVVEYTYDAWGKLLTTTGSAASTIGRMNPFRYRGYYYDEETGFYYLNSRYYDPEVGRFINADAYVSTGQGILGYNMFAYCNNNPVMLADPTGNFPWLILAVALIVAPVVLSGCSSSRPTSNVGAASDYYAISKSNGNRNTNPNCYSYALGYYNRSYDPGDFSGTRFNYDVDSVGNAVEHDLEKLGRSCRKIQSYDSPINDNEYRIALRVSKPSIIMYKNGYFIDFDYHFMVQTSSGNWAEKHGPGGATICHSSGNPETISWDLGSRKGYYDSKILYYAISK